MRPRLHIHLAERHRKCTLLFNRMRAVPTRARGALVELHRHRRTHRLVRVRAVCRTRKIIVRQLLRQLRRRWTTGRGTQTLLQEETELDTGYAAEGIGWSQLGEMRGKKLRSFSC